MGCVGEEGRECDGRRCWLAVTALSLCSYFSPDSYKLTVTDYYFFLGLGVAVLTIFIQPCFVVAELRGGFGGALADNKATFIDLETL